MGESFSIPMGTNKCADKPAKSRLLSSKFFVFRDYEYVPNMLNRFLMIIKYDVIRKSNLYILNIFGLKYSGANLTFTFLNGN